MLVLNYKTIVGLRLDAYSAAWVLGDRQQSRRKVMRTIATNRKNYLFMGSENGGDATTDHVSITDWYTSTNNHVASIETADGYTLDHASVSNLVNAMAAMTPPPIGQTELTVDEHTQLDPVLAANWQH